MANSLPFNFHIKNFTACHMSVMKHKMRFIGKANEPKSSTSCKKSTKIEMIIIGTTFY